MNIDEWFRQIREKYAANMQCGRGCTACCHGLFDISLSDAVEVARGFHALPPNLQECVRARAAHLDDQIHKAAPDLAQPAIVPEDDQRIDRIIDAVEIASCPCLGETGECLIYDRRPLACRLEGVPMVDIRQGLFGDWCELNFKDGIPQSALAELEQDYDRLDELQESQSSDVARRAELSDPRAVTFIPSVIVEHESFWKRFI